MNVWKTDTVNFKFTVLIFSNVQLGFFYIFYNSFKFTTFCFSLGLLSKVLYSNLKCLFFTFSILCFIHFNLILIWHTVAASFVATKTQLVISWWWHYKIMIFKINLVKFSHFLFEFLKRLQKKTSNKYKKSNKLKINYVFCQMPC